MEEALKNIEYVYKRDIERLNNQLDVHINNEIKLSNQLDKATSKLDVIKKYIDSELIKISSHQYAIGTRRLNNILSIIDKD